MNRQQLLDGFQLNNHLFVNKQVDAESFLNNQRIVSDGYKNLLLYHQAALLQFVRQAELVDFLQQSGTQCGMNRVRGMNDALADYI